MSFPFSTNLPQSNSFVFYKKSHHLILYLILTKKNKAIPNPKLCPPATEANSPTTTNPSPQNGTPFSPKPLMTSASYSPGTMPKTPPYKSSAIAISSTSDKEMPSFALASAIKIKCKEINLFAAPQHWKIRSSR